MLRSLLSFGLGLAWFSAGCQGGGAPIVTVDPTPSVELVRPERVTVERTLVLTGNLRPYQEAKIYARIPGYLRSLQVDLGDPVVPGQLLGRIESPEAASEAVRRESLVNSQVAQEQATGAEVLRAGAMERELSAEMEATLSQERVAQAGLARTWAQADLASRNLRRLEQVYADDPGSVAGVDLDSARAQVRSSRSLWEEARANLDLAKKKSGAARLRVKSAEAQTQAVRAKLQGQARQTEVAEIESAASQTLAGFQELRSPFRGIVTRRNLDPGDLVQASNQNAQNRVLPVLVVADTARLRVAVEVPETEALWVKPGTAAQLERPGLPARSARVTRTSQALHPETRTMTAEIDLDNCDGLFQAGGTVGVRLRLESHPNVWAVPPAALIREKGKATLWVVESSVAQKKSVTVGFENERWAEISSGLEGQEEIVVAGASKIAGKGGAVRILPPPP
jgi:RND family efflux transporter MFP subunit